MRRMKLVAIGNGMAGIRTLEELLRVAPDLYEITVFGAEPHPNYNRILLSPVLAGEQRFEAIVLNDFRWYADHGITLHPGSKVTCVDRQARVVVSADGRQESYDRLLFATGSVPIRPPIPGTDLPGVLTFRDIADTQAMIEAAARHKDAVVIGGGLLGLEAANGLLARGMNVTVIHLAPWLMERQLDATAAALLQTSLEQRGLRFLLNTQAREIVADDAGRVGAVRLNDGAEVPAALVVLAVGIRPNDELARACGLHCERGIVVDDTMMTYDPRIYAVGECISHRGISYGLVAPLFEQAKVCANHLGHLGFARYTGSTVSTKLKVTGIDIFSAGHLGGDDGADEITLLDRGGAVYKKLVLKADRLIGSVLFGDTADSSWYSRLVKDETPIGELRGRLILGQPALGSSGHQGEQNAAALPDDFEVCGCNGVCKGTIVRAIKEKGLFTLDDVRKHTKASSSCGSCTGLVEQLLASVVGGAYQPRSASQTPVCECTDYTHEEVRRAIRDHELLSIPEALRFLEWRTPNGCATCRPALNYYLLCAWPGTYRDDPQSRLVNERAHANIQRDGTYSVVPRIYGGVTTPAQLRQIAEVAEKYAVPTVKITGGQRIDLLGVRKEDLPRVWADLGMPSGFAYGKSVRTVKTCVGSEWCRFGVQDSTRMGIELEQGLDRVWTPHKVKLGVSGCPRNCAESTIKDVGVVGVDSGWEIYVGGNGGTKAEVAQFLAKVALPAEAMEYTGAFLQLYREEARYLDRTSHWIHRVGLDYVKRRIVADAEGRKALYARLTEAQRDVPDPWALRVARRDPEFETISARDRYPSERNRNESMAESLPAR
ncbi:nitrite reductase large subunit NirB [Candidatus Binatia bacterium]|nr:nitrite reductase large subunit NirB [Candidatus Binatia bacterium]